MSLRFKTGDLVWYNGVDEGEILRVEPTDPALPYYVKTQHGNTYAHPCRVAPRVIESKPTTWRLPEPGDVVLVIDGTAKGKTLPIATVNWIRGYPLELEGCSDTYDLTQVQLVRLRDAPQPTPEPDPIESAIAAMASEPTARPEPFQTLVTDESKHIKADLDLAIQILERSNASNGYEELGNYARKAIAAALPLLQHISDTFENLD